MKRTPLRRKSKSKTAKLQTKADTLLTPIVKKISPKCEGCGKPTEVAHHWIEKSRSLFLRYDVKRNLIALCHSCHAKIHNRFGNSVTGAYDVADIIIKKRGRKWKNDLDRDAQKIIKGDVAFYEKKLEDLNDLQKGLS